MSVQSLFDKSANPCVLHLIPQHGIGGAEIAASSATFDSNCNVHVHAMFNGLYEGEGCLKNERLTGNPTRTAWFPASILGMLRRADELEPQVFVFSLWRTFGAFIALKLRYPDRKFVTFVHNERVANPVDKWITACMMRGSDEIWVDSQATMDARLSGEEKRRARIISLRLERRRGRARKGPAPKFVYWGRLAEQKRIDRALDLFARVAKVRADARFTLIGPDHGVRDRLAEKARRLAIADGIVFHGPKGLDEIGAMTEGARFFLQLSDHEGMAMGVVEALERGLVPVVTPVGQMAVYCRDGENALVYRGVDDTAERLLALFEDPARYEAMSEAALATFADTPTYSEEVAAAARALTELSASD